MLAFYAKNENVFVSTNTNMRIEGSMKYSHSTEFRDEGETNVYVYSSAWMEGHLKSTCIRVSFFSASSEGHS